MEETTIIWIFLAVIFAVLAWAIMKVDNRIKKLEKKLI